MLRPILGDISWGGEQTLTSGLVGSVAGAGYGVGAAIDGRCSALDLIVSLGGSIAGVTTVRLSSKGEGLMVWREQFERAMAGGESRPRFQKGLDDSGCAALEKKLKVVLPTALRELLLESNGVQELLKLSDEEEVVTAWLIWPAKMIGSSSPGLAKAAMRIHKGTLVFFAPADDVTFALDTGGRVLGWYAIDRELRPIANSLAEFVEGWPSGKLEV